MEGEDNWTLVLLSRTAVSTGMWVGFVERRHRSLRIVRGERQFHVEAPPLPGRFWYRMDRHKVSLIQRADYSILSPRTMSGDVPNDVTMTIRIGLIDDDASIRRGVGRLLQTHGYVCTTYDSAEAALADPALIQMNCIIVDIHLGGINGFELCNRLDSTGVHIPRVFITAHVDDDLAGYSHRVAHSLLLTKPFEETQLIDSINKSISAA
jgi:CheY-like chemotaxis protein